MRREVHVRFGEERQGDSFDYALSLTPLRVKGRWCYLYRAIDSRGATIDFLLSAFRDADAAKRLFRKALSDRSHPQPRVINTRGTHPRRTIERNYIQPFEEGIARNW